MKVKESKKGLNNVSKLYLKRFMETGYFRPISGWKETQLYHKENFGDKSYSEFSDDFKPENWNPDD